ncbi:NAD(P)/FAD-dependent oxidoreductase [Kribbella sp. NPDC050281]|uniref:flavin-containing monooxygenase n=1 Tax=Kribbella sp. NPDC050281 TaxID=3155515 RepID=UPI0033D87CA4
MISHQVAIIGAGTSGVSAAVALADRGVKPLLVDRADQVGSSWRSRYDRLRLNTGRQFSHLPNRPYPSGTPTFPTRDQVIDHIERHANEDGIELCLGCTAERLDRADGHWRLTTSTGEVEASQVVVATGFDHEPFIPDWPGRDEWPGGLIHSSQYRNPLPYNGKRVLVVGPGSSGMEIAYDLATGGAAKVWLAVRTPPNIMLRQGPGGIPGDFIATPLYHAPVRIADAIARFSRRMDIGDLHEFGLPVPAEGIFARSSRLGVAPAILDKDVIAVIRDKFIEIVRGVGALDAAGVALADGTRINPDAMVCATGFRRGLAQLVGHLGVLDERGWPTTTGEAPAADGLRFIGFVPRPSQIGFAAKQARRGAQAIAQELRRSKQSSQDPIRGDTGRAGG